MHTHVSKRFFLFLFLLPALAVMPASCKKDSTPAGSDSYNNRLGFIMSDNFDLTLFNVGLTYTHYSDTLLQPGPYTVLAPSDEAFEAAGYGDAVAVQAAGGLMNQIIGYHILRGTYELNLLPYEFNQEIQTLSGAAMYVTHWVKNGDTVLTINGASIQSLNVPASNGLYQVLNQVLSPAVYTNVQQAITADSSLTYFNAALLRSGLAATLQGTGPFTVFAPTNAAFRTAGYATTDTLNQMDPGVLTVLLNYHILSGRRFVNDYILTTDVTNTSLQAMLDGNNVTVQLIPSGTPGSYSGITVQGSGNTTVSNLVRQNVLAGNGVLHTIDQVLKTNF
jgi:uncharacterized surface protein with fasciclin (FAS1) repeats